MASSVSNSVDSREGGSKIVHERFSTDERAIDVLTISEISLERDGAAEESWYLVPLGGITGNLHVLNLASNRGTIDVAAFLNMFGWGGVLFVRDFLTIESSPPLHGITKTVANVRILQAQIMNVAEGLGIDRQVCVTVNRVDGSREFLVIASKCLPRLLMRERRAISGAPL